MPGNHIAQTGGISSQTAKTFLWGASQYLRTGQVLTHHTFEAMSVCMRRDRERKGRRERLRVLVPLCVCVCVFVCVFHVVGGRDRNKYVNVVFSNGNEHGWRGIEKWHTRKMPPKMNQGLIPAVSIVPRQATIVDKKQVQLLRSETVQELAASNQSSSIRWWDRPTTHLRQISDSNVIGMITKAKYSQRVQQQEQAP